MKKYFNKLKPMAVPAVLAFSIWLLLNVSGVQNLFFREASVAVIIIVKISHLIFLFLLINLVFIIIKRSKKDVRYKDLIKIACIYGGVLLILLLLIWPGAWAWDDLGVIHNAEYYGFTPWQHFLSGFFHVMALQTLPFAAGIIIIQTLIASLIVGYIVSFLSHAIAEKYKKSQKWAAVFLFVPFFFFPVLFYVLTGYRMAVYQYLEILIFVIIIVKNLTKGKITYCWLVLVGLLVIVVGAWRTEGLTILIFVPVMLFFLKDKLLTRKKILIFFAVTLGSVLVIGKINTAMIGNENYKIGAIIYPLVANIRDNDSLSEEEKTEIDKVLDLSCLEDNPNLREELVYHECIRSGYSNDDYSAFFKTAIGIIIKNPKNTFSAIGYMFWRTSMGVYTENEGPYACSTAVTAVNIFTDGTPEKEMWDAVNSRKKTPINNELRTNTINILAGTPDNQVAPYYPIFWNHIVPIVLTISVVVLSIIRKKWLVMVAGLAILCRAGIVALTAMAPYFMYYMPVYVSGYVLFVFVVLDFLYSRKNNVI